ncbi:hypothetical protein M8C21_023167 [Ambrosia artemisiifolia]|uniref:MRH domain-containing protein n=1 Tax=Ambrosia artemisiifolia TaxID=4212 RepID=A0AAD5GTW8_AMBAR|nr:hypothetical protein M8C21_023167 [Ambrosia artemisiifolia]
MFTKSVLLRKPFKRRDTAQLVWGRQWEKFDESHRVMLFTNGDKCWNGPQRSLTVRLRCGSKVELADIDEPSRCEYSALLTTPALCQEGRLKELEDKLEAVNKDQPQGHDEL